MYKNSSKKFSTIEMLYKHFLNPILSQDEGIDAERLTQIALALLAKASMYRGWPGISNALKAAAQELQISNDRLEQKLFGCHFKNPVGLAAGFDKNGVAAAIWDLFGFGFAEIGTVTWHAQPGNPKPRLFRLAAEKAALNRMGFNNNGALAMQQTLQKQKLPEPDKRATVIGVNLGKSKMTTIESASDDYFSSLKLLASLADYVVINVSSPNTPGLRDLQASKQLKSIIKRLKELPKCPPLLVKIAPDLSNNELDDLAKLANDEELAGLIAVNTSINRLGLENRLISQTGQFLSQESGGLSGAPLQTRATEVIRQLRIAAGPNLTLIGVGGIHSPQSAWERVCAGANLLQVYTGWIFQGPALVSQINEGLITQLDRHGFKNISEAVGSELPWI